MDPASSESPPPAWIDIPWAGLRSIQRGTALGLSVLAGLPAGLTPLAAAVLLAWLAWRESGSRAIAFQAAVDGCLGALFGLGIANGIAPLAGWMSHPLGMGGGAAASGMFFAFMDVVAFRPSRANSVEVLNQQDCRPNP